MPAAGAASIAAPAGDARAPVAAGSYHPGVVVRYAFAPVKAAPMVLALALALGSQAVGAGQKLTNGLDGALLERWLTAVEQHSPGDFDGGLLEAARWTNQELDRLWVDTQVLVMKAVEPKRTRFRVSGRDGYAGAQGPNEVVTIRSRDLRALNDAVLRARTIGVNALLRRSALLHTDVATLVPEVAAEAAGATSVRTGVKTLVGDGSTDGAASVTVHWALARMLLSKLYPDPRAHTFVRDWYRATVALAHSTEFWDSIQLGRGLALFPDDAVLLWLKGCQHEAYAAPLYQAFMRSFAFQRVRPEIEDRDHELAQAERYFRRALAADASLVEPRLHLGRVLGLRGRPEEARRELVAVLARTTDVTVEYYGRLFLGAEQQAAGDLHEARSQFRRAAAIAPDSRVPYLALAQIARELGDRTDMQSSLDRALAPVLNTTPVDPWWIYHASHARRAESWMQAVRSGWRAEPR